MTSITQALQHRILVLDGAMGTMLQSYAFSESDFRSAEFAAHPIALKGNNDLLSLTQPQAIAEIHSAYLAAGADIIETNTFSSTTIGMADYGLAPEVIDRINLESAQIARRCADEFTAKTPDKPRFVAGCIGPTNRTASMSSQVENPAFRSVSFQELKQAYKRQALYLYQGGVDVFLVETVFDTLNAKAALFAIDELRQEKAIDLPIMVSGTITDNSGRTLSGQTVEAFVISVSHLPLLSIGFNCALGAEQLYPYLHSMSQLSKYPISVHPNAGLPNAFGQYDQTPALMQANLRPFFEHQLLNIVGGCCGTTPAHIQAIAELAAVNSPRIISSVYGETSIQ